jgi:hypothetical protein
MWRRLLIELSDEHRESILINWCIRELSQLGYHREIAQVIREADYFSVCNELLVDTLLRLGSAIAEGGSSDSPLTHSTESERAEGSGSGSINDITSLMTDLKRMCGSTEYMFIYTYFLLSEVMKKLSPSTSVINKKRSLGEMEEEEEGLGGGSVEDPQQHMWRLKVRRLQEELEDHLVWRRDSRGHSSRGWRPEALSTEAKFALQLTTENAAIGVCSNVTSVSEEDRSLAERALVVLGRGSVTPDFIEMLFMKYFQRYEERFLDEDGNEISKEIVMLLPEARDELVSIGDGRARGQVFEVLHHPQLLHLLIMHLVGGGGLINGNGGFNSSSNNGNDGRGSVSSRNSTACLLALASCTNKPTFKKSMSSSEAVLGLAEKVSRASEICLSLGSLVSYLFFYLLSPQLNSC